MFFFFFQAEDGIRDLYVTGVQTCALPISHRAAFYTSGRASNEAAFLYQLFVRMYGTNNFPDRSEEHTSELQSRRDLVCRLLLEKKKNLKCNDRATEKKLFTSR